MSEIDSTFSFAACSGRSDARPKSCCFCLMTLGENTNDEQLMRCCWCGRHKLFVIVRRQVDGHGPLRETVRYEPKE